LRACIAFLRQLEVSQPTRSHAHPGTGCHAYAVFSFRDVEEYFDGLSKDSRPAGLLQPYAWPDRKERQKVVQLTLEVLFKTVVDPTDQSAGTSLLESCQEVCTCLKKPIRLDWRRLEDSNADLLREVLHQQSIDRQEFEALCSQAVTDDLLPLARRLGYTVEDTVGFLLEASHLQVIEQLSLGTAKAQSRDEKSWEVCLSPALLRGEGIDTLIAAVVQAHQRRRADDIRDWELVLREYLGVEQTAPSQPRCLRQVLLAFLGTGEDVVEGGCGACSGCRPKGDFLPLAERESRIITIPPELWSRLETVRKAVDVLPDMGILRHICAFLQGAEGTRWRRSVYLNTERMLREDRESAGATALLICFIAHRWVERGEDELGQLFDGFWQKRATFGSGLAQLAELAADAWPKSVTTTYWRARLAHAEGTLAGRTCWLDLLKLKGVPRAFVHEAASALTAGGDLSHARLAARSSSDAEEAERAYGVLSQVDLRSVDVLLEEVEAVLGAEGSERARAETFVGLLVAAWRRGAPGPDLLDLLDLGWDRIETALSDAALVRLIEALVEPLAADSRWSARFVSFLAGEGSGQLRGAILTLCARFLEQGSRFTDSDCARIAAALCRIDPQQLQPPHARRLLIACADQIHSGNAWKYAPLFARAGPVTLAWWANEDPVTCTALLGCGACAAVVPCAALEHLWNWAIERQRADVVRSLCLLKLTPEGRACRQLLLEGLMFKLLSAHRDAPHEHAD